MSQASNNPSGKRKPVATFDSLLKDLEERTIKRLERDLELYQRRCYEEGADLDYWSNSTWKSEDLQAHKIAYHRDSLKAYQAKCARSRQRIAEAEAFFDELKERLKVEDE